MNEKDLPVVNTGILGGTGLYQIDGWREARGDQFRNSLSASLLIVMLSANWME